MKNTKFLIAAITYLLLAHCSSAKDVSISMMYSNATDKTLPFELVSKGRWVADPNAQYVKLHMYMDEPIGLTGVEIDRCDDPGATKDQNFSVFVNFDEWVFRTSEDYQVPTPKVAERNGRTYRFTGYDPNFMVRSLTWNFEETRGIALCGLRIFDGEKKPFVVRVPEIVGGKLRASSTLKPTDAYDVINLFDSRFEYAWASDKVSTGVDLTFDFDQPRNIQKLRIWSGYQRSPTHCYSNSRPKVLHLTGDSGYNESVKLADVMGSQLIQLPKPFNGKHLVIGIEDSFKGKVYADVVISELRFWDGKVWFLFDPLPHQAVAVEANRKAFKDAGLGHVLNEGLYQEEGGILRIRADGSFYLSGSGKDKALGKVSYFALGNYEVSKLGSPKGLQLRLFGLYYPSEAYGDCNGCGRDCNKNDQKFKDTIFQEYVYLRKTKHPGYDDYDQYELENASGGKKLPFSTELFLRNLDK